MIRPVLSSLAFMVLFAGAAQAACPPPAPGNTAAEIQANGQRLVCIQNQLAAESAQKQREMEIDALRRALQQQEIERRLDALSTVPVYQPPELPLAPSR